MVWRLKNEVCSFEFDDECSMADIPEKNDVYHHHDGTGCDVISTLSSMWIDAKISVQISCAHHPNMSMRPIVLKRRMRSLRI